MVYMRDQHSIPLIAQLHPKVRKNFQDFVEECESVFDITIRIISAYRSLEEQEKIYAIGRTVKGENATKALPMGQIVTKAPPGSSYHNWGLAGDIAPLSASGNVNYSYDQSKWANIAQKYNISWGGNWTGSFKDLDHWENKMGHNWRDLLDMYHKGEFIPGTHFVNI